MGRDEMKPAREYVERGPTGRLVGRCDGCGERRELISHGRCDKCRKHDTCESLRLTFDWHEVKPEQRKETERVFKCHSDLINIMMRLGMPPDQQAQEIAHLHERWRAYWQRIEHLIAPNRAIVKKLTADSGHNVNALSAVHSPGKDEELDEIA
jgi:hypothetical protein